MGPDPGSAAPVRDTPLPGLSSMVGLGLKNPAPSAGARPGSRGCEEAGAAAACAAGSWPGALLCCSACAASSSSSAAAN